MEANLPLGQVSPEAKPVGAFIQPAQFQPGAVAGPPGMPQLQGIATLRGPDQASYGGVNRFQELAQALAPLNANLTSVLQGAGEAAVGWASQQGEAQVFARNAALRALSQADATNEAGAFDYAKANRELGKRDPEGGILMNLLNPYREQGVQRGLAKLAGAEAEAGMLGAYEEMGPTMFLSPDKGQGALAQLKAGYIKQLTEKYGLDTASPGFLNYALPKITAAEEKISNRAREDRVKFLDSTLPGVATGQIRSLVMDVQRQVLGGTPQITIGGSGVTLDRKSPTFNEDAQAEVMTQAGKILAYHSGLMGSGGQPLKLAETVYKALRTEAAYGQDPVFKNIVDRIKAGPTFWDPVAKRAVQQTLAQMFPEALIDIEMKYGWAAQKRQEEQGVRDFADMLINGAPAAGNLPAVGGLYQPGNEGPLDQAAMVERSNQLLARFRQENPGAPVAPLLKAVNDQLGLQIDIKGKSYAPDAGEEVLGKARDAWGSDFDPAALRRDLAAMRGQINPAKFGEVASKLESIIRSKDAKASTLASAEVNRAVEAAKDAALSANYGADYRELQRAGSMNARTERAANLAESVRRYNAALYPAVNSAVAAAAAKKGGPLDPGETYEVASQAAADFATKNQAAFNLLFPGGRVSGAPSLPGLNAMAPDPNAPRPTGKPAGAPAPPTWDTRQLDSMPNRQQRLRNYQNESILSKEAVGRELVNAANGGGFSPQLRRAAMDALAPSPAEFLRIQGARYGINVPPAAMKRLNDQSSAITTPQRHLVAMAAQGQSALGSFGRWALDAATGARPASAAEWPRFGARSAAPGQFTISMRSRGDGGGRDGGGPFMDSGGGGPYQPLRGVTITSRVDASGEPGFDMAVGGSRAQQLAWPTSFQVLRVVRTNSQEIRKERGDAGRSYGNLVEIRFRDPRTGRTVDVLSAHHDRINPSLQPGRTYPAGTILGNQGRTGSTTAPHFSLDFFDPGSKSASGETLRVRDYFRDEFERGGRFGNGIRTSGDRQAMTGKATFYTGSGGSDGQLGGRTANGEVFTGKQMTAAVQWGLKGSHMNKWLIVEDPATGKKIRVWANDTGQMGGSKTRPADRVIDLSPVAFNRLYGSTARGVGDVRIRIDPNQRGRP